MQGKNEVQQRQLYSRGALDRELEKLDADLIKLAEQVQETLTTTIASLNKPDLIVAHRLTRRDEEISHLKFLIERSCHRVIALQQPQVRDLRRVLAIYSIAGELDRIADHASGISRLVLRMQEQDRFLLDPLDQLITLVTRTLALVQQATSTYFERNIALAKQIIEKNRAPEQEYGTFTNILAKELDQKYDHLEPQAPTHQLWILHNIDRIQGRVTLICERVIFYITGSYYSGT